MDLPSILIAVIVILTATAACVNIFYSGIPAFRSASKFLFLSTFLVAGPFSIFDTVKFGFIRITSEAVSRALPSSPDN